MLSVLDNAGTALLSQDSALLCHAICNISLSVSLLLLKTCLVLHSYMQVHHSLWYLLGSIVLFEAEESFLHN